jgi:hypothetical protein
MTTKYLRNAQNGHKVRNLEPLLERGPGEDDSQKIGCVVFTYPINGAVQQLIRSCPTNAVTGQVLISQKHAFMGHENCDSWTCRIRHIRDSRK